MLSQEARADMNWISNYVRPKINSLFSRRELPENLWRKCDECGTMLFHRELQEALHVCPNCQHHMLITPRERFEALFDGGLFVEVDVPAPIVDPLAFRDEKRYADRIRDARRKTGEHEAMLVGEGEIGGLATVCAAQDFSFMGGSMGMQEGILSLMQMPRTTVAVQMLREAGLPYVCVLTHPTTGGVTASYAMLGDVQIAEPGALIGFAGQRVIEQTIGEKLPEGFQRAEYLLEHGMLDRVIHRRHMRDELAMLLRLLTNQPPRVMGDLAAPDAASQPALTAPEDAGDEA